MNRVLSKVY